ncbi:MAG: pyruvate dehydrogenase E1 component, alpha subunit [uncultured archaeon A07HB70]|nr:MAG: pyruvate dehydrogenase E1 component, alpha subunit [uncultured archaeon A07HB70]
MDRSARESLLDRDPDDPVRVLDDDGAVVGTVPDLSDSRLVELYRDLRLARRFDARAVSLQRQGRMGTYPPMAGQEGAQVGSAYALADRDWVFPSYREHAVSHVHGVALADILRYWMGDERGSAHGANVFPVAVPIATQIPHAVGFGWAAALAGDDVVTVAHFGDGATSEGDFHEALNFAGVFDTPTVFCCHNNQWAISVPRERQTASATLAGKASAYGFTGVQVDGMDPLAVYRVVAAAVERARTADGAPRPTLVESLEYRFGAHTTADDPTVYRDEAEVERWRERDPIPRLEAFLRDTGRLDDERVAAVETEVEATVADAVEAAEETRRAPPTAMFDHVYAEAPSELTAQRAALAALYERVGEEGFE